MFCDCEFFYAATLSAWFTISALCTDSVPATPYADPMISTRAPAPAAATNGYTPTRIRNRHTHGLRFAHRADRCVGPVRTRLEVWSECGQSCGRSARTSERTALPHPPTAARTQRRRQREIKTPTLSLWSSTAKAAAPTRDVLIIAPAVILNATRSPASVPACYTPTHTNRRQQQQT
jgi:hypothetical protein